MKQLIKTFGYNELDSESKKQGWRIPTKEELQQLIALGQLEHDVVWVSDPIDSDDDESENYAHLYDVKNDRLEICHKNHRHHAVVEKVVWTEKEVIMKTVEPCLNRVLALMSAKDEEKVLGRLLHLSSKVKDEDTDAMLEMALLAKALELKEDGKL